MLERPAPVGDARATARAGLLALANGLSDRERAALSIVLARAGHNPAQAELGLAQAEAVLTRSQVEAFDALCAQPAREAPADAGRGALTVILKTTRLCNLRCAYCHSWKAGPNQVMPFSILARTIRSALAESGARRVEFVWHGGEATLLPIAYYRAVVWLQEQFRQPGQVVGNSVQTNGTRLTDEWIDFLRTYQVGVGISLDGPPEVHDSRRRDIAGRPTSAAVRRSLERIRTSGIRGTGILFVVDDDVVRLGAQRILDYLLELAVPGVALLNALPDNTPPSTPLTGTYLPVPHFVEFLRDLFQLWWPAYAERLRIRELAALVSAQGGDAPGICVFAGECFGRYLTVEPSGEVSACDKYIGDRAYVFGNVLANSFGEIDTGPPLEAMRHENRTAVDSMAGCRWFAVCRGACPHDRYTGARHLAGYDGRCCGFAPLLEDISDALRKECA